jgi:excisionase family DNA binding protein
VRNARTENQIQPMIVGTTRGPLLDVESVAGTLGVTTRHVRRLVAERRIPFFKVGKFVRFDPAELDVWLSEQRVDVRSSTYERRAASR